MHPYESLSRRGQLIRLGQLAQTALRNYPLEIVRLAPLKHEHNTTFRVWAADGGRYVLRIHRPGQHTTEAIRSELLWLLALGQDTDLGVPQPILTKDSELLAIASVDGVPEPRVCVLFRWLEGRFLDSSLTAEHLEGVGILTASLHEHSVKWLLPPQFERGRVDIFNAEARRTSRVRLGQDDLSELVNHPSEEDAERSVRLVNDLCSPEDGRIVSGAIQKIRKVLKEIGYTPETFSLIHADLHQENYFFHRGGARVIDFDDCGFGHYLFDLNVTLIEVQRHPRYGALREAFLTGYRSVRSLPVSQEGYLETFFALRHLQLLIWVLESREHPTFRDQWEDWAQDELQMLQARLRPL